MVGVDFENFCRSTIIIIIFILDWRRGWLDMRLPDTVICHAPCTLCRLFWKTVPVARTYSITDRNPTRSHCILLLTYLCASRRTCLEMTMILQDSNNWLVAWNMLNELTCASFSSVHTWFRSQWNTSNRDKIDQELQSCCNVPSWNLVRFERDSEISPYLLKYIC